MKIELRRRDLVKGFLLGSLLVMIGMVSLWKWAKRTHTISDPLRLSKSPDLGSASLIPMGVRLVRDGKFIEAKGVFEALVEKDPKNPTLLNNLAYVEGELGDWVLSAQYLEKALQVSDKCSECWNNLGVALYRQGKKEEARPKWKRAVELAPNYLDALLNLGVHAEDDAEWEEAVRVYSKVTTLLGEGELRGWIKFRLTLLTQVARSSTRGLANQ